MPFYKTAISGLVVIEPKIFEDSRGYFFEAYNKAVFEENGIDCTFLQDNQSKSSYGVIRGLHFQQHPYAQSKLVRVLEGTIYDVAVDIRKGSPTYGQHVGMELSSQNKKQFFIPAGFAHGFSVLSETAIVLYKCDALYNKQSEGGIRFDDPQLGINWQLDLSKAVVSEKDVQLPSFKDIASTFEWQTA